MKSWMKAFIAFVVAVAFIGSLLVASHLMNTTPPNAPPGFIPVTDDNPDGAYDLGPAAGSGQTSNPLSGSGTGVTFFDSQYAVADGKTAGWFASGQDADIMLSGFGFGESGGPLMFNHPANIATDGRRLLLADTRNNRILIWNSLPLGNEEPDVVLGQDDFDSNLPGISASKMNWPIGVATDGQRIIVADTNNNRVLIWSSFPSSNGEPADMVLGAPDMTYRPDENDGIPNTKRDFMWPWGVWTDGEKLVVTSTLGGFVLIWNSFPEENYAEADITLRAGGDFGTPRAVGSDGTNLVIGDHNARVNGRGGNFFWKSFPESDDQPYDFFMSDPGDPGLLMWGLQFTGDGKFVALGSGLYIWDGFPQGQDDAPDLVLGRNGGFGSGYRFVGGDGSGLAVAGGRLYVSLSNGNKVVAFNEIPAQSATVPDFAIGAPGINDNTLADNFIITNPVPSSDGTHLFVTSDFDGKLYVWKGLPDESGAGPDIVYGLDVAPWDNALHEDTFAIAGKGKIEIWESLPLSGEKPGISLGPVMGNVAFIEIGGIALDDRYLYVSEDDKIYAWEGIPESPRSPDYVIDAGQRVGRLSSSGDVLAAVGEHEILLFKVGEIAGGGKPVAIGGSPVGSGNGGVSLNLPAAIFIDEEHLFVSDTGFNRVLVWNDVPEKNSLPDVVLGQPDFSVAAPGIGSSGMHMPSGLCFDGSYLWVGEFKFSQRILRFSPHE